MNEKLLEVNGLKTCFSSNRKEIYAVDDISFHINRCETLAIVGESGSGKSVTSLSIMQLIQTPPGRIAGGEIIFDGSDLLKKSKEEMQKIRGSKISMIFQEPMTSLNPLYTCGWQICESIKLHQKLNNKDAKAKAIDLLTLVGIPLPAQRFNEYPHQLSGGMRQRVMIAIALSCNPLLLIADEPTTALDVTIQAQILKLLKELKIKLGMSILLITHDLGVVAETAERVIVMYEGKIVEEGSVIDVLKRPMHPYTEGLLKSIPKLDNNHERLYTIKGNVAPPGQRPSGCSFHLRCPYAMPICKTDTPKLESYNPESPERYVSCWRYDTEVVKP